MDPKLKVINAAMFLAENGAQKKIIQGYIGSSNCVRGLALSYGSDPLNYEHRAGIKWIRDTFLAVIADRAYRLFTRMFFKSVNDIFDIVELQSWYLTYRGLYPGDEVSINRLHYLLSSLRAKDIVIIDRCNICGEEYIIHPHDYRTSCALCSLNLKQRRGTPSPGYSNDILEA